MTQHILRIENDGPRIRSTDFWQSPYAEAGICFLSFNAGTTRLLLPDALVHTVSRLVTAKEVIISRGPWPARQRKDGFEVLFEDGSNDPLAFHLGTEQLDRLLDPEEDGKALRCTVWVRGDGDEPRQVLDLPAHLRFSMRLPDLRPWPTPRTA